MCVIETFERVEKKYMLTRQTYKEFREELLTMMQADEYGLSSVSNIYYDTDDFSMIRTSLERPIYKEKLRLRGYGLVTKDSTVFMEIKKKYNGVVYKRREAIPVSLGEQWMMKDGLVLPNTQITGEINHMKEFYHPKPKVVLSYDRLALFGREDETLRVTFDFNVRYRDSMLSLTHGNFGSRLIGINTILMEIKIPGAIPLWLVHMIEKYDITPVQFSKYGFCYKEYLSKEKKEVKIAC